MHTAVAHLQSQLRDIQRNPVGGFAVDIADNGDLFVWKIHFAGPEGSLYYPGIYKADLKFPQDFPFNPPVLTVTSKFWHPNVYDNGNVCMSIIHAPGVDEQNELETASMRYSPIVTIEKILISFVSLLSDPDPTEAGAPANVDALAMYRKNKDRYIDICKENAKKSLAEVPKDFVMPQPKDLAKQQQQMMRLESSEAAYEYDDGSQPCSQQQNISANNSNNNNNNNNSSKPAGGAVATASSGSAPDYTDKLRRIKEIVAEPPKTDAELLKMLEKYRGDVDRVMESLWD